MADAHFGNLYSGKLEGAISASTTSLGVDIGTGTSDLVQNFWPEPPFYITVMPASPALGIPNLLDSEIMLVSAKSYDSKAGGWTLTVSRGQKNTAPKAFSSGAIATVASYADDAVVIGSEGGADSPTGWIKNADIDWTTLAQSLKASTDGNASYIQIGKVLIQWGRFKVSLASSSGLHEASTSVVYPKPFASAPAIATCPDDIGGVVGEHVVVYGRTNTGFTGVIGAVASTGATNVSATWIAIGIGT